MPNAALCDVKVWNRSMKRRKLIDVAIGTAPADVFIVGGKLVNVTTAQMIEDKKLTKTYMHRLPAGRFGDPAEVADAVVFLSSAASDFVFGRQLLVDGGYTSIGHLLRSELAANKRRAFQ